MTQLGPGIKQISQVGNEMYGQGGFPVGIQTTDAAYLADPAGTQLLAGRDPVIREVSVGMTGEEAALYDVSGTPPLSLPNSLGKPLKAWEVALSPYQDLHGYDSPWPAGGGKNLYNKDGTDTTNGYVAGKFLVSSGAETTPSTPVRIWHISEYIRVLPSTRYIISGLSSTFSTSPSVCWYDANKEYIGGGQYGNNQVVTFDTTSDTVYVRISVGPSANQKDNVQIEKGVTATAYSPYSNLCPIYGTDKLNLFVEESYDQSATPKAVLTLPQTVYTGTIGSEGGESRWASKMFDGSADEGWAISGTGTYVGKCPTAKQNTVPISSTYPMEPTGTSEYNIRPIGNNADFASVAEWRAYLAEHPMQVVYETATPTAFTVSSVTIPTPSGTATTWATAEDGTVDGMEVTYVGKA